MRKLRIRVGEHFELDAEGMGQPVALAVVGAAVLALLIFGAVMLFTGQGS